MNGVESFIGTTSAATATGAVMGYALKRILKIAAVILGAQIAVLTMLEQMDVISVDWVAIESTIASAFSGFSDVSPDASSMLEMGSVGGAVGGFGLGFVLAFNRG